MNEWLLSFMPKQRRLNQVYRENRELKTELMETKFRLEGCEIEIRELGKALKDRNIKQGRILELVYENNKDPLSNEIREILIGGQNGTDSKKDD